MGKQGGRTLEMRDDFVLQGPSWEVLRLEPFQPASLRSWSPSLGWTVAGEVVGTTVVSTVEFPFPPVLPLFLPSQRLAGTYSYAYHITTSSRVLGSQGCFCI